LVWIWRARELLLDAVAQLALASTIAKSLNVLRSFSRTRWNDTPGRPASRLV